MKTLRERLDDTTRFLRGVELVSVRGSMAEASAVRARSFANELIASADVDWISVTDNAGGNPQMAPQALGKPILYAGKEVVIHLTCKDLNRNALEGEAWLLHSEGFHNVLAMTGDYPVGGDGGTAKPVFDIDSVSLIAMLDKMNGGFGGGHEKTDFCIGAVTTNYKMLEGEVIPQYLKLRKKIACGARFIINQVGYDARKAHELRLYMDRHGLAEIPLVGNVYLLNPKAAQVFHSGRIPGIVLTQPLLDLCLKHAKSPDHGREFFLEFAAKQMAVFRGLGYRGAYIGGLHDFSNLERILELERTFAPDDWKTFAREIRFSRAGEFFYYGLDPATGLADPENPPPPDGRTPARGGLTYWLSGRVHGMMFTPGRALGRWGAGLCSRAADPMQGPRALRAVERVSKSVIYGCRDCGDCSLPEIAFLCPESQCAKNQRNGPCGGTREGRCEVDGIGRCIWLRAYERLKRDGKEEELLGHRPVIQNQALRGTSSWANFWLARDHSAHNPDQGGPGHPDTGPQNGGNDRQEKM